MTQNNRILIVEDDEITALHLTISLQKQGYNVVATCATAMDAKRMLENHKPDIIIIDISLQEGNDGINLAYEVKKNYEIPFIFLTSYSDDAIISEAKLTEPYGYIVKPFDPSSLHATLQMALFRYDREIERKRSLLNSQIDKTTLEKMLYAKRANDLPIVVFGEDYHLDISICETFYKDEKIKLTKKENAFLRLLVAQLGQVVSFAQAMNYVWEDQGATENSVRTLVWRLRNKLQTDIIKNASGIGYYIQD